MKGYQCELYEEIITYGKSVITGNKPVVAYSKMLSGIRRESLFSRYNLLRFVSVRIPCFKDSGRYN